MITRYYTGFSSTSVEENETDVLDRLQDAMAKVARNDVAWTYTILGFDGSPYITRTLLPRVGSYRTLVHTLHRDDADPHPHNHPWRTARFRCVSGGYTDERWVKVAGVWTQVRRLIRPGDHNLLASDDFHRAVEVLPSTRTVGVVGERVQDWGFLVDDSVVPHDEYFRRKGYVDQGGRS